MPSSLEISSLSVTLRLVAMPDNTNPYGAIFGGWLLSHMDMAGSSVAMQLAQGRVVTVGADAIKFKHPISIGDEVSLYAEVIKQGTTSITVQIEVWIRERLQSESRCATSGFFTYVKIDEAGKPVPIKG